MKNQVILWLSLWYHISDMITGHILELNPLVATKTITKISRKFMGNFEFLDFLGIMAKISHNESLYYSRVLQIDFILVFTETIHYLQCLGSGNNLNFHFEFILWSLISFSLISLLRLKWFDGWRFFVGPCLVLNVFDTGIPINNSHKSIFTATDASTWILGPER